MNDPRVKATAYTISRIPDDDEDQMGRIMDLAQQQRPHPERLFHALQQALGGMTDAHYGMDRYEQRLTMVEKALRGEWPESWTPSPEPRVTAEPGSTGRAGAGGCAARSRSG